MDERTLEDLSRLKTELAEADRVLVQYHYIYLSHQF